MTPTDSAATVFLEIKYLMAKMRMKWSFSVTLATEICYVCSSVCGVWHLFIYLFTQQSSMIWQFSSLSSEVLFLSFFDFSEENKEDEWGKTPKKMKII